MDSAYDKKFSEMKKYIPFLESMIKRLENSGTNEGNPRQAQLDKIRSLRDLLLDKNKRMKMDNLLKCEQVLINLYAKVEKRDQLQESSSAKPAFENEKISPTPKADLETVRNKLKTVAKINDGFETSSAVARGNDVEFQYTGDKEPALFQRRPNKSPTRSSQISPNTSNRISPQPRRSYTRVLVSPDASPRRWSSSERSTCDKPLFSRRSPAPKTVTPPPNTRKEKKKSKVPKSRKTKNLNITLNVPQESLNSLNAEDILPRILNCNDDDADIETLNELRSQILGNLKQLGHNEDISNLILQSYKTSKSKKKNKSRANKDDVEEGELSDSESEAIDSIYGNLSSVDKDKISLTQTETIEGKSNNQQRKIQISLVLSDKDSSVPTGNASSKQDPIVDLSEFEMVSDEECDNNSKEVISIDSDSSPNTKHSTELSKENLQTTSVGKRLHVSTVSKISNEPVQNQTKPNKENKETEKSVSISNDSAAAKISTRSETEVITVEDDVEEKSQRIEVVDETCDEPVSDTIKETLESRQIPNTTQSEISVQTVSTVNNSKNNTEQNQKLETNIETRTQFIANFYKPLEDDTISAETPKSITKNLPDTSVYKIPEKESVKPATISDETISTGELASILSGGENTANVKNTDIGISEDSTANINKLEMKKNQRSDESQNIPLLNEPTVAPQANAHVLSEIDILQALKNEILSEPISVPGVATTPALHQPNVLTKVASAQDILFPKKKITVEAYQEMAPKRKGKNRIKIFHYNEARDKKQSIKLTDKEKERFQFPKRLSLDDVDDISDDDLSNEDIGDPISLDNLYSDLAPKSPDHEIAIDSGVAPPPIIIPVDPVKTPTVNTKSDVDMRAALLPTPQSPVPPLRPPPLMPLIMGHNDVMTPCPMFGNGNVGDIQRVEPIKPVNDTNRFYDPRIKRDTQLSAVNSPNPYTTTNHDRTPRPTYANVVSSAPNMTPTGAPNMTPSMTPSYMPSIPQLMTPNARMTPSHQTFELEESSVRKHVYAPSFSMCNRERESSVPKDGPHWEINNSETRMRRSRWDESNIPTGGPKWEMRDMRGISSQNDGSRTPRNEDAYVSNYKDHVRVDKYSRGRRDSYSKLDCPMTPVPSFGWSECPSTPGSSFGRQEAPMTPTPSFGRTECPPTPSHAFGRSDCPSTPSHPFGRSECTSYGRSDGPNSSNQKFLNDPRINRRPNEYESNFNSEKNYSSERGRKDYSFKSQNRYYTGSDRPRNYERERSVGKGDKKYGDRKTYHYDRDRRESSVGRSFSNDYENDSFLPRDRESRYDKRYSNRYDKYESKSVNNQIERSISQTSNTVAHCERSRSTTRPLSVEKDGEKNSSNTDKDDLSFRSDTGRKFTINTSVKSTFQEFRSIGQSFNLDPNSFNARRQRASSVGRSLVRENSAGRTLTNDSYAINRKDKFKRASSVGRECTGTTRTLQEVKADFEAFKANIFKDSKSGFISTQTNRKTVQNKQQYSPTKNARDPRVRRDQNHEIKNRYKIDRRNDSNKHKKTGIVYSNDNIAKGTIMGAGFAVKNYKIPKIKRPEPEPVINSKADEKPEKQCESELESDTKKNPTKSDKRDSKSKPKETSKAVEAEQIVKVKVKNVEKPSSKSVDETEGRITRSRKKSESKETREVSDDNDIIVKTRKSKKSNKILDSDSEQENEDKNKSQNASVKSPIKNCNKSSPKLDLNNELPNRSPEGTLSSTFTLDDIFSDNLPSDPVIDNINALIENLDHHLETTKVSNESFTEDVDHIFDAVESPVNSLGDISEVIEKDLNESEINLQKELASENILTNQVAQDDTYSITRHQSDSNTAQKVGQATDVQKNLDKSVNETNILKDVSSDDTLKINDNIVSTTEIGSSKDILELENVTNKDGQSPPDSTLNKNTLGKTLPDSTNDELSSEVTSTNENAEISNKDIDVSSTKEPLNQIGNILSILKDKSKIKELLSMLGEQTNSDNEKLKKKLEKLSQIVSDEEDNDEEDKELNIQNDKHNKERTENNIESISTNISQSEDNDKQLNKENKENPHIGEENLLASKINNVTEIPYAGPLGPGGLNKIDGTKEVSNANIDEGLNSSHIENVCNITNEETMESINPVKFDSADTKEENKQNSDCTVTNQLPVECANEHKNDVCDKKDAKNQSSEDDEPLHRKDSNKIKRQKIVGKSKEVRNKKLNKRTTRAASAKTKVKKKGELQKLQEDIQEMFMSKDILNATGIRMCRLAKIGNDKESVETESVVVPEKVKAIQNQDQPLKLRKKPGPKPKVRTAEIRSNPQDEDKKETKLKTGSKNKSSLKSKTKCENDPYEFDTDSIADTNTTKDSDSDSSDSATGSLASSHSFGSSEVLNDTKKKKRRRGGRGWQAGIIKARKRKDKTQEILKLDPPTLKPQKPLNIPDLQCFTDKSYCFQKGVFTYDCRLCVYSGHEIVKHFKEQHPHTEIPLSRLEQKSAEHAIAQCEVANYLSLRKVSTEKHTCRFCHKEFSNSSNVLETFFWHVVTNHTGEFKHLCPECVNVTRCPFNLDIPPPPKDGGQLIGYICKKCNFTQISLKNLKTHVVEQHRDEETEVFTINLAVMTNKAMKAMLKRAQSSKTKIKRSLRSNNSTIDTSDAHDDHSDASESSVLNSECDTSISQAPTKSREEPEIEILEQKPKPEQIKTKFTFEEEEPSDETSVKMEQDDNYVIDESSHLEDTPDTVTAAVSHEESRVGHSDDIMDYAHFKVNYTPTGAKEYICCINGIDGHYKTSLLISMKKHIQSKHSEKWDGYCCICKVLVTLQGVQSDFRDCLSHFLDKHIDDFPVLEKVTETTSEMEATNVPESVMTAVIPEIPISVAPSVVPTRPLAAISPAIPARVATPPVERTASPSYIAVRPMTELLSQDLVKQLEPSEQIPSKSPMALPKISCVVSLGDDGAPPAQSSPAYPSSAEPPPASAKPLLYEEFQAEVMSKKHRVVLEAMMSKENLVRVFKCAGRFCSFTTDSVDEALMHATAHQRVGGEGSLLCAYCSYDTGGNGIDLVMHAFKEHSRCAHCCPACFYRAAAPQLVEAHYTRAHAAAPPLQAVLRSAALAPHPHQPPPPPLARDRAVPHFVCQHDDGACTFKSYIPRKFIEHIQQKHPNATSHPCNYCESAPASPGELVLHLRTHGLRLYQCTYCVHGGHNESELLAHVAAAHPDRPPQAYVRLITQRGGGQRVLPLAIMNKSTVPTEDVVAGATKENPDKAAERSIELEKLIAHTSMIAEMSNQPTEATPIEEPEEIPVDNLEEHDDDEPSALESLLVEMPAETDPEPAPQATENTVPLETQTGTAPAEVKSEPIEVSKTSSNDEVICLDSDDDTDTTEPAPTPAADVSHASEENSLTPRRVKRDFSTSSVTDDVSITKITGDSQVTAGEPQQPVLNRVVQNVIDLSDDEPSAQAIATTPSKKIIDKLLLYKCPACLVTCKSAYVLKNHAEKCTVGFHGMVKCPHAPCTAVAPDLPRIIAHYHKMHRELPTAANAKPNVCGVCKLRFPTLVGAKKHVKLAHKINNYEVRSEKTERGVLNYVVVALSEAPVRASARKTSTEIQRYTDEPGPARPRKASTELRKRYGVADIDKLPISPILDATVYCDVCEFSTKVRLNMVRHLQQHAERVPAPRTQPVNPVPHLESNEMHFDKMLNLAASSLGAGAARAPEPALPAAERQLYPRYVPERMRYTCGARACSYISLDQAMFRRHWDTLHAAEQAYCCVHCPPHQALDTSVPLSAARILAHLRMHDAALYACSACSYYHYSRALVERHVADVHHGAASARTVRDHTSPEPSPPTPAPPPGAPPSGAPTMDLKRWRCGLCDFSNLLRAKLVDHCAADHQSKMQFKCSYCPFRTSTLENVGKHQANVHPSKPEDVFYYFYKEGTVPEEADGVPLWQKQRKKQGLGELKTEPEPVESPSQAAPAPAAAAPLSIDLNIVKEEKPDEPSPVQELSVEELCKKFGEFCEPDGRKYKCCLCNVVREHERDAMRGHLYEELNYRRWECVICSYKAFHKNGLHEHMASEHSRQFNEPRALPTDASIEAWLKAFLDYQAKAIEVNLKNLSTQNIQGERVTLAPAPPKKPEAPKSNTSDTELENAFGEFGAPKNQHYACPKCDFVTIDEGDMVAHLESELSKIRWGCTICAGKFTTYHEAQFHCKSAHTPPGRPKEAIRDPSLRTGWVKAVVESQKQFIKCVSTRELSPDENREQIENSLLVALYDEPVQIDERAASKRPAPDDSDDDDRLVIAEPPAKKANDRQCPSCDYSVNNSRYMREHILLKHHNIMPYKCSYCVFEGTRGRVYNHLAMMHSDRPKNYITVDIPTTVPKETMKPKRDKEPEPVAKPTKRDTEEVTKKVCLYCEKSVPETEIASHTHGTEKPEFAKRGEVVVKCCKCLVLRLSVASLQDHFDACHPGEKVSENYAFFKLQVDTREIYCCDHCYKKFKFNRDLKAHHLATHTSLSLSYSVIPFSHNLHTEGEYELTKRKLEDTAGPSPKRVARKSTSKLPNSAVAKKSTTKLPYVDTSREYSFYGERPTPASHYRNVTVNMPTLNSVVQMNLQKVASVIKIDPRVVLTDYNNCL